MFQLASSGPIAVSFVCNFAAYIVAPLLDKGRLSLAMRLSCFCISSGAWVLYLGVRFSSFGLILLGQVLNGAVGSIAQFGGPVSAHHLFVAIIAYQIYTI